MATPGINLDQKNQNEIFKKFIGSFNFRMNGKMVVPWQHNLTGIADTDANRSPMLHVKIGAPASNTEADAPSGINDICWDSQNDRSYRCSAYTNGTTFTWTALN